MSSQVELTSPVQVPEYLPMPGNVARVITNARFLVILSSALKKETNVYQ